MPLLSWSKWSKHKVLAKHEDIASAMPDTRYMRESTIWSMLDRHGKVVLKPTKKWGGQGLMLLAKKSDGRLHLRAEKGRRSFDSREAAWRYIQAWKASKSYIVQQYIPLATIDKRPFDIRVMVQRRRGGSWAVTGKIAKVAGSGHFITNMRRSHGRVMEVERALSKSELAGYVHGPILRELDQTSLAIARHLGASYKHQRVVGLDMALDRSGRVWFIEANFSPMVSFFRRLKDKSVYRRILRYQRG